MSRTTMPTDRNVFVAVPSPSTLLLVTVSANVTPSRTPVGSHTPWAARSLPEISGWSPGSPETTVDRHMHSFDGNRVVADTGSRFPIFNAPIGYFARSQLAGAVSAAGGMGLFELNS